MEDNGWPYKFELIDYHGFDDNVSSTDDDVLTTAGRVESKHAHLSHAEGCEDSFGIASLFSEFDDRQVDAVTAPLESYFDQFTESSEFAQLFNKIGNDDPPSYIEQQPVHLASDELLENYGNGLKGLPQEKTAKTIEELIFVRAGDKQLSTPEIMRIAAARFVQSASPKSNDSPNCCSPFGISFSVSKLPKEVLQDLELAETLILSAKEVENEKYDASVRLLRQCDSLSSDTGSPVQRVVFYFSKALWEKIYRQTGKTNPNGFMITQPLDLDEATMRYSLTALAIYEKLPFCQIVQFAGIQAIAENMADAKKIHVIDLGIRTGMHWPILMQALASRNGCPLEILKITAVATCSMNLTEEIRRWLTSFADALEIPFAFRTIMVTDMLNLDEAFFDQDFDEKVAVYTSFSLGSMLRFPDRLDAFMKIIRNMNPRIMVVTEVEANHNSKSFVNRFTEALFYYSAFFDCFETFMGDDPHRMVAESMCFPQGILNILAAEGEERSVRHVKIDVWRKYFARFGMMEMELSSSALHQANILVQKFDCKGSLAIDRNGSCLILGWMGTPIFSLSVWDFLS